jgi:hypothetical protein
MRSNKSVLTRVGVLVCVAAGCLRAQSYEACEPAPAIKAAIDKQPSDRLPAQTEWQFHEKKRTALQALLAGTNGRRRLTRTTTSSHALRENAGPFRHYIHIDS